MKQAYITYLKRTKGRAPTTKQVLKAAAGKYNADDKEALDIVMFLFDKMAAALYPHSYHKKTKYYAAPYACKLDHSKKPLFTASNRAMIVLLIENCREKWQAIYELKKKNSEAEIPAKPAKTDLANPDWKYHRARWSNPDSGQCKFTSWDPEGLKLLKKWTATIEDFMTKHLGTLQENEDKLLVHWQNKTEGVEVGDTEPAGRKRKRAGQQEGREKVDLKKGEEEVELENLSDDE